MPQKDRPRHPPHLPPECRMMIRRIDLVAKSKGNNSQPNHKGGQHHQKNLISTTESAECVRTVTVQNNLLSISTDRHFQTETTLTHVIGGQPRGRAIVSEISKL